MKRFADLNLRVPLEDQARTESMIHRASELGYKTVAIPLPLQANNGLVSQLKQVCGDAKVDFVTRVNISPRNTNELLNSLRRYRRKFEIISVRCNTKDVARQAAKDRRVDLLQFSVTNMRQRFFDHAEAELASQALSSLEIELAPMLQLTSFSRTRLLSCLRKEVATAEKFRVQVTLSSGATDELFMRGPYDYAALTCLFDMSASSALKALSENPVVVVERNRLKLSPGYVAPGIRVVGRRTG